MESCDHPKISNADGVSAHFTLGKVLAACAACSQIVPVPVWDASGQDGPMDLDGRPAAPARYTVGGWVTACKYCGYVGESIEHATKRDCEIVKSEAFQRLRLNSALPAFATIYEREALLVSGSPAKARSKMCVTWLCDDAGATEAATASRIEWAIYLRLASNVNRGEETSVRQVQLVDVLRRSSQFVESIALTALLMKRLPPSDPIQQVLRFHEEKSRARDVGCYTTDDACKKGAAIPRLIEMAAPQIFGAYAREFPRIGR